jgi:hypothetical protein
VNILVVGGFDPKVDENVADIEAFCAALGRQIMLQGHCLIGGCQSELDALVAKAAYQQLQTIGEKEIDKKIVGYSPMGQAPVHKYGKIINSRLKSWDPGSGKDSVPEPIQRADVVILIRGFVGTFRAAHWSKVARKPVLPIANFGGAAREEYDRALDDFDNRYGNRLEKIEFEELNAIGADWDVRAKKIVSLAEKAATSKCVLAIMSYANEGEIATELDNVFESFQMVCKEFGYVCTRVDESNTTGRILPKILREIELAAFVIADLTELKQNVFYELGYAEGHKKSVVVTAKEGTKLPFDVKDIPTLFWRSIDLKGLRSELRIKIQNIAETQGRSY